MASSELLKQIQAGKKLKKAETNDRSAPLVDAKAGGGGGGAGGGGGIAAAAAASRGGVSMGGAPQLGGLFAGGVPKLKPSNNLGTSV
jgi:WAS/WASL-interacting protein